jgi:hypothetical protein
MAGFDHKLDLILEAIEDLKLQESTLDQELQTRLDKVIADTAAVQDTATSAVTAISGLEGELAAAIQKALDAGASADQLTALDSLHTQLGGIKDQLAAAVATVPPAPTPAPAPTSPQTPTA